MHANTVALLACWSVGLNTVEYQSPTAGVEAGAPTGKTADAEGIGF